MARKTRIDRNSRTRPLGLQWLEDRLTLSAVTSTPTSTDLLQDATTLTAGYFNVSISKPAYFFDGDSNSLGWDVVLGSAYGDNLIVEGTNNVSITQGQTDDLSSYNPILNDNHDHHLEIRIITPPALPLEKLPKAGGWVDPTVGTGISEPPSVESPSSSFEEQSIEEDPEGKTTVSAESEAAKEKIPKDGSSPNSNRTTQQLAPTRGRDIFLQVASTDISRKFSGQSRRALYIPSGAYGEFTTASFAEQYDAVHDLTHQHSNGTETQNEAQTKLDSDTSLADPLTKSSKDTLQVSPVEAATQESSGRSAVQTDKLPKVGQLNSSLQIGDRDIVEEQARNQVFAEWRTRDLIVLPVLMTLVAGPGIIKVLRTRDGATHQQPPKRKRQTIGL